MRSHRYPHPRTAPSSAFAGYRFPPEVITLAVRWYLRFGLSYRDAFIQNLRRGFYDLGTDAPPAVRLADAFAELTLVI